MNLPSSPDEGEDSSGDPDGGGWWAGVGRVRRRRSLRALAVLAVLVLVAGAGYLAGRRVADRSAEADAEARPPPPTALTEPVVHARIAPTVTGPATISAGAQTAIDCLPAMEGDARKVFTKAPVESGSSVAEGSVLAEVNGRPVIALVGAAPAYRDLRPDDRGGDVAQLQEALSRLGFFDGQADGHYGPATWNALAALYEANGYEPVGPSTQELDAVEATRSDVAAAADRMAAAVTQEEYDRAHAERAGLRDQLASLEATTGPMIPFCEIVFVPGLPAVAATTADAGNVEKDTETPDAPSKRTASVVATDGATWISLGTGEPTAELVLSASMADAVEPGLAARMTSAAGTTELEGEVRAVRDGTPSVAIVEFSGADPSLDGVTGTLSITLLAPDAPVLAVSVATPVRAPNGSTTVLRVEADGTHQSVEIETGASDGVAVEVLSSDPPLEPGDELLIGVRGG